MVRGAEREKREHLREERGHGDALRLHTGVESIERVGLDGHRNAGDGHLQETGRNDFQSRARGPGTPQKSSGYTALGLIWRRTERESIMFFATASCMPGRG